MCVLGRTVLSASRHTQSERGSGNDCNDNPDSNRQVPAIVAIIELVNARTGIEPSQNHGRQTNNAMTIFKGQAERSLHDGIIGEFGPA